VRSGIQRAQQFGEKIVGGSRVTSIAMCSGADCKIQNPYNQVLSYAIAKSRSPYHPGAFIQNSPVFTGGRFEIDYGVLPAQLDLDFSSFDRLRIEFGDLTETLNFNVLIDDNSGFKYA
jgi:hypothetical protein